MSQAEAVEAASTLGAGEPWWVRTLGPELLRCPKCEDDELQTVSTAQALNADEGLEALGLLLTPSPCDAGSDAIVSRLRSLYAALNSDGDECVGGDGDGGVRGRKRRLEVVQVVLRGATGGASTPADAERAFRRLARGAPWLALPFADTQRKIRLWRRWGGGRATAPSLALLDASSGRPLCRDAAPRLLATASSEDSTTSSAEGFPWRAPPLLQLLRSASADEPAPAPALVSAADMSPAALTSDIDVIGLYFSANWCPPCKAFTPHLQEVYERVRSRGHRFEVVFVSSDRSEQSFAAYASGMPWLALPWVAEQRRRDLASQLAVAGIPALLLLNAATGAIIARDGRALALEDPQALEFPWYPKLVELLTDRNAAKLQENPAIILFVEGCEEEVMLAEAALRPVAEAYRAQHEPSEDDDYLHFFVACDGPAGDGVRAALALEDVVPLLVTVDLPCGRLHALDADVDVNADSAAAFVADFLRGELPPLPLPPLAIPLPTPLL